MADIENEKTYDAVFWTSIVRMKRYFAPLVNEVFGEHFSEKAEVTYKPMKTVVQAPDKSVSLRETDSLAEVFEAGVRKLYHFECQTWPDNTIALRIAEYATASAYVGITQTSDGASIEIPNSAVIILRGRKRKTPDDLRISIRYPGGEVKYKVPRIYITDYDEETLFQKKLFILMPFVLFLYAPEFRSLEKDPGGIDKLRDHVSTITENLYRQYLNGELEKEDINSILDLMERILEKLLVNYKSLEKGVDYIMGGELIKTRTDEAREQGLEQGRVSVLIDLVLSGDISAQKAAEKLGISKEEFEERMRVVQDK